VRRTCKYCYNITRHLLRQIDDYRSTIDELDTRISDINGFVDMMEGRNVELKDENEMLRRKIAEMEGKFDSFKQKESVLAESIEELKSYHIEKERFEYRQIEEEMLKKYTENERQLIVQFETREAELLAQIGQLTVDNKQNERDLLEVS
jgi:chromosome segregation ATPase